MAPHLRERRLAGAALIIRLPELEQVAADAYYRDLNDNAWATLAQAFFVNQTVTEFRRPNMSSPVHNPFTNFCARALSRK
jgi:hypothetical protein